MDPEMMKNIGVGGGSGIIGVLMAFFGLKSRIKRLEEGKVDLGTCTAIKTGIHQRVDDLRGTMNTRFDTIENLIIGKKK